MKKLLVTTLLAAAVTGGQAQVKHQSHGYPIDPVPFTSVTVSYTHLTLPTNSRV